MGLFDIFSTPAAPAQPAAVATPVAAPTPAPTPATVDPGGIPATVDPTATPAAGINPANPADVQVPNSPMAEFANLWDTPTIDPNATTPEKPPVLTAEAVQKVVANANFAGSITPELMTTIAAGGEEAKTAMMAIVNSATQQAVTQAIMAGSKLNEQAIAAAITEAKAGVPELLRAQQAAAHLKDLNPLFANPAMAPVADAVRSQLLQKFPSDTPAQTSEKVNSFMTSMAEQFTPKEVISSSTQDVDWEAFMTKQ